MGIDDDSEDIRLCKSQRIERSLNVALIRFHVPANEQGSVRGGNERECVRDQFNGRRIVNNIVEFLFEPFREFLHGAAFEEFVRAGGRSSLINDVKVFVFFGGAEKLLKGGLPGEIIAQSRDGLFLKVFGNTPFPNIGVNQDYFHIRDGEHKSQIDGNRRFSLLGIVGGK